MSQTKRNHRIWMGAKPNQFGCVPTQRKPKNCGGVRSPTRKNLELQRGAKSNQTNLANQGKPKNYEGVRSHLWIGGCILPPSSDRPVPASSSQFARQAPCILALFYFGVVSRGVLENAQWRKVKQWPCIHTSACQFFSD